MKRNNFLYGSNQGLNPNVSETELIRAMKKRRLRHILCLLIPFYSYYAISLIIFNRNQCRMLKGRQPGGLINLGLVLLGAIIPVAITNKLLELRCKNEKYYYKHVLGIDHLI